VAVVIAAAAAALVLLAGALWLAAPRLCPGLGVRMPGVRHGLLCVFHGRDANERLEFAERFVRFHPGTGLPDMLTLIRSHDEDPRVTWAACWLADKCCWRGDSRTLRDELCAACSRPEVRAAEATQPDAPPP
jgi:hypothetical protein